MKRAVLLALALMSVVGPVVAQAAPADRAQISCAAKQRACTARKIVDCISGRPGCSRNCEREYRNCLISEASQLPKGNEPLQPVGR